MAKKFLVVSFVANELGERLIPTMDRLIADGYTAVTEESAFYIRAFRDNLDWVDEQLNAGKMLYEAFASCNFEESLVGEDTARANAILNLHNLLEAHIKKDNWLEGRPAYKLPGKLSPEAQDILDLSEDAGHLQVLIAAYRVGRMDLFEKFNAAVFEGLARQHDCDYVLSMTGVTPLSTRE